MCTGLSHSLCEYLVAEKLVTVEECEKVNQNPFSEKTRQLERAYFNACIDEIDASFTRHSEQEQKDLRDTFLQSEDFSSFHIDDFRGARESLNASAHVHF